MPQIPYEPVPQVMPEGKLAPMQIQASPADFGAQVGQTLQQTGSEAMQNALARQQFQNETTVNDVTNNKFFPAFQDQYQKYYTLQGKDALDQLPAYQQSMRDLVTQFRGDLANRAQQKMFDEQTSRRLQFEIAGMSRYADQQNKVWQAQTNAATVDTYINSAADKYNDSQAILGAALGIRNQISRFSMQSGQGAEVGRQQTVAAWNKLYDEAITRRVVNDAAGAKELFDDGVERGLISGTGQTAIAAKLKPYLNTADASQAYSVATSGPVATRIVQAAYAAGVEPSTALSIWSAEGAVTNPETKNPNSSATGVFQFMPGTWADMGGTEENRADAGEQIAKGVESIKRNMVGFRQDMGRWPQGWESYLAHQQGLGGAERLIKEDPNTPAASIVGEKAVTENGGTADMSAGELLSHIRQYFQSHAMQYNADATPTAQNLDRNYAAGLQAMTDLAEKDHPNDPEAAERYRSFYIQQTGQTLRAAHMTEQANREVLRQALTGQNGAKSWSEFLSDPVAAQAYTDVSTIDPSISGLVDRAIAANAQGMWDPPASAQSGALCDELKGMQTTDRGRFANLDLMQYYGSVPAVQFQELQNDQALARKQDPTAAKKQHRLTQALVLTNPVFVKAGIDPDPVSANYNIAVGRLDSALNQWSANNNNKLPDDGEIVQIARQILFQGGEFLPALLPDEAQAKGHAPDDKNSGASINAGTTVVESQGRPESHGDENGKETESREEEGELMTGKEAAGRGTDEGELPGAEYVKAQLSARDKAYLDKYYDEVTRLAKDYDVAPALVLAIGGESGFATDGTYRRTGDAFGMTGGSTEHMTNAKSAADNVAKWFHNYGSQIWGLGNNTSAFINALQGRDASGAPVQGWKKYNSVDPDWEAKTSTYIKQMLRDIPIYLRTRPEPTSVTR